MIFGNEGMPRSGKSLDAMQHIIDSIRHGRCVVTNIHGINYAELAKYLVIPEATIRRMLITLTPPAKMDDDPEKDEKLKVEWVREKFYEHQINDCLWIWDEINQFWPVDRQPLPAKWAKFVTEHGHLGIDVLIMGQDLTELHKTWRGRLQRYTRFTKLDMRGKEDNFHWATFSNSGRNRYTKTAQGEKPYNKAFFPLYKSHRDETTNKGNYKDARFNIFQTKHKVAAFCLSLLVLFACYNTWSYFHPKEVPGVSLAEKTHDTPQVKEALKPEPVAPVAKPEPVKAEAPAEVAQKEPEPIDYLDGIAKKYDLRLSAYVERKPADGDNRPWFEFVIDAVDPSFRRHETFNRASIAALGWTIEKKEYGILLSKQGIQYVVRPWPFDSGMKVSQGTLSSIRTASKPLAVAD